MAALAGLATAGCDGGQIAADVPQSSGQSFVGHSYESAFYQVGQRPAVPAGAGTTLTGQRVNLDSYKGKTVGLNFRGSWGPPCPAESPARRPPGRQMQPTGARWGGGAAATTKPGKGARGLRDSGPRAGRLGPTGWLRWFWRQLTSMRTALILLFLLALASVPGSVLPQEGIDPAAVTQYYQS